jgi:protease PrsW
MMDVTGSIPPGGLIFGLVPVTAFLVALIFVDSYKLVRAREVFYSLGAGMLVAVISYFVNTFLLNTTGLDFVAYARYVAPVVEETGKAAFIWFLIKTYRVGFLVDAAIHGFAIGAGFALLENFYYLYTMPDAVMGTWLVRGLGTAIMHGGVTAIFGMMARASLSSSAGHGALLAIPPLLFAIVLHSLYNHMLLPPVATSIILFATLPIFLSIAFQRSEQYTRSWLRSGFDSDQELLTLLLSGNLGGTRMGQYIEEMKSRFAGTVVVDMLCLLRLHAEVSLRAKGILMMREAGFEAPVDPSLGDKLKEIDYLRKSIGRAGMLAIAPLLPSGDLDQWQQKLVGG